MIPFASGVLPLLLLHAGHPHSWLFVWFLVAAGIVGNVLYYGGSGLGLPVRRGLQGAIRAAAGVGTRLGKVELPARRGRLTFRRLQVENPPAFRGGIVAEVGEGEAEVTLATLLGEEVEIPRVELRAVRLHLAIRGGRSNAAAIVEALRETAGCGAPSGAGEGRRFRIRELVVTDLAVSRESEPGSGVLAGPPEPIPELRLTEVGGTGEPLRAVVAAVLTAVLEAGERAVPSG